jgi:hypothetical protein
VPRIPVGVYFPVFGHFLVSTGLLEHFASASTCWLSRLSLWLHIIMCRKITKIVFASLKFQC